MRLRRALLALPIAVVAACGAKTGLYAPPYEVEPECVIDADCKGFDDFCEPKGCELVPFESLFDAGADAASDGGDAGPSGPLVQPPPVPSGLLVARCVKRPTNSCDDNDPCTTDVCDPVLKECRYTLATLDSDGDGYRAPRPGFFPGEPDSCGDDCDDTNAAAHPGGIEVCDGVDNDCNGKVDDGAAYTPVANSTVKISDQPKASTSGLAWSGTSYAAVYSAESDNFRGFLSMLTPAGQTVTPPGEQTINVTNSTGFGGPAVWTGDRFGLAWTDRRTGDYEIFFNVFSQGGAKFGPDVQLTDAFDFSLNPSIAWNGSEFLIVWEDRRNGMSELFAQRVSVDGVPNGGNLLLTPSDLLNDNQAVFMAAGVKTVGISWSLNEATPAPGQQAQHFVSFQLFSVDLAQPVAPPIILSSGDTEAVYSTVVWNKDRYVIAWQEQKGEPGIYAATVSEEGAVIVPRTMISDTPAGAFSRYPSLKAFGDRVLVVFSDTRNADDYEIWSRMMNADLTPKEAPIRLTQSMGVSTYPVAAFGPDGDVGVLFMDARDGLQKTYFTRLACTTMP